MSVSPSCSFDSSGQRLATLSSDGKVKIWKTDDGALSQEFTPALRSDSSCTCLCWSLPKTETNPAKRRKRKHAESVTAVEKLLIGTSCGSVRIFDPITEELENLEENESLHHDGKVSCVCFGARTDLIYTCGNDKQIIEWSRTPLTMKSKWKIGKQSATALALSSNNTHLISGGRVIKLWCVCSKSLLQKFSGHLNPVTAIRFTGLRSSDFNDPTNVNGCYFLSWSKDDSFINAWHVNSEKPEKSAIATFVVSGNPIAVDCVVGDEGGKQPFTLCVAGNDGKVNVYSHTLNGKMKRPLQPVQTVSFNEEKAESSASQSNSDGSRDINLLSVRFTDLVSSQSLMVAFGNTWNPQFENMSLSDLPPKSTLYRQVSPGLTISDGTEQSKKAKQDDYVLGIGPLKTSGVIGDGRDLSQTSNLSMEERLGVSMEVAKASKQSFSARRPTATSVSQILIQGLQSQDDRLIETVIKKGNKEAVVKATIQKLPSVLVLPFIRLLVDKIQKKPIRSVLLSNWIKAALSIHMTYLLSMPHLISSSSGLYQLLESRTSVYSKLTKLHGRLDVVLSQSQPSMRPTLEANDIHVPTLTYHDGESSDEGEMVDKLLQRADDDLSDDEWDVSEDDKNDDTQEENSKEYSGMHSDSEDEGNESGDEDTEENDDD